MKRTVIAAMTAVLLVAAVGMVLAQEAQPESRAVPELTADELAVLHLEVHGVHGHEPSEAHRHAASWCAT